MIWIILGTCLLVWSTEIEDPKIAMLYLIPSIVCYAFAILDGVRDYLKERG